MTTIDQLSAEVARLREELAQARERIAVLEARPVHQPPQPMTVFGQPATPTHPWPRPPYVTCGSVAGWPPAELASAMGRQMTPAEIREQRVSWAFGQAGGVDKEHVQRVLAEGYGLG